MLGKLTWAAIPFDQPIVMIASGTVGLAIVGLLGLITVKGWWPYLWREWTTSVDHKRIGVMYVLLALVMLVRGFADAIMMRSQLALAAGEAQGFLPPEHYNQIFSAHGTIMIFFVAMPFVVGLMNFALPLQLGVRDVAFQVLNSVSFWLTAAGVLLVNMSLVIGEFARTGWLAYPPLSEIAYSPGVGVDIGAGFATILTLASFWASSTQLIYGPGVPILLGVLAIAQMGVHLVFFLHISSAPDQTNNFLALAFGIFVVGLVVFGSMIIMANLNHAMMPMDRLMQMQR
jgi:cytochrome o ubiquinol oxidase subunit IV